jgi:hypothetical protein
VTCAGSQRGWLGIGMADYARRVASLYWLVTIVLTLYKPYIYTQVFIYIWWNPTQGTYYDFTSWFLIRSQGEQNTGNAIRFLDDPPSIPQPVVWRC